MAKGHSNISSPPSPSPANDELDSLSNTELVSFLESSFRRSEFIRVAGILQSREELAKGQASMDLSAKVSHLAAKVRNLKKVFGATGINELVGRLKEIKKLAVEKLKILTEEADKERANCLRIGEQLEKQRTEKMAEIDSWRSKYSLLEAWILRFLEKNPHLVEKVRGRDINEEEQNLSFLRINEEAEKLLISNVHFGKKDTSLVAGDKFKAVGDIRSSGIELFSDSSERKRSVMKNLADSNDKNCSKRKFQIAPTSEVQEVSELDDEDDVICINEEAEELLISNVHFGKKESFLVAGEKSGAVGDIRSSGIELFSDTSERKRSAMKNLVNSNDKNCSKRKFQIAPTSEVQRFSELDDEDDVICIKEVMAKKFAKWSGFDYEDDDDVVCIG